MNKKAQLEHYVWDAAINPDSAAAAAFFQREPTGKRIDKLKEIRDLARQMRDGGLTVASTTYTITPEQYVAFRNRLRNAAVAKKVIGDDVDIEKLANLDSWKSRKGARA